MLKLYRLGYNITNCGTQILRLFLNPHRILFEIRSRKQWIGERGMRFDRKYLHLLIWIALSVAISGFVGFLNQSHVDGWYRALNRSALTPPDYVFGLVWPVLYALIGASGWCIWRSHAFSGKNLVKRLYVLQFLLNWSWTPLFFRFHCVGLALACVVTMVVVVAALMARTYGRAPLVSLLLSPYFLWLVFATYLNFYIWHYNDVRASITLSAI